MLRLGTAMVGLLALGAGLATAATAEEIKPLVPLDPKVEQPLQQTTALKGRLVLNFSLDDEGDIEPSYFPNVTVTEMDKPWPDGAQPKPFGPLIVNFYDKPGNTHCFSYWNGSKWVQVCPNH